MVKEKTRSEKKMENEKIETGVKKWSNDKGNAKRGWKVGDRNWKSELGWKEFGEKGGKENLGVVKWMLTMLWYGSTM